MVGEVLGIGRGDTGIQVLAFTRTLDLPTFEGESIALIKRLTLISMTTESRNSSTRSSHMTRTPTT
jgi:hypothetical protein